MSGGCWTMSSQMIAKQYYIEEVCTDICDEPKEEVPNAEGMAKMLGLYMVI